ncbi:MAG: hypothetical protein ACOYMA_05995 [Bacteroidia bacterium]
MKNFILFCFSILGINVFAQKADTAKVENLLGIQARMIDLMPFEISYMRFNTKGPSFAVRGGYGWGRKNESTTSTRKTLSNPALYMYVYSYNYGRQFTLDQTFEAIFIKPGIIIFKSKGNYFTNCLLFNYCIAKSFDKLAINAQDQLYGNVETVYYENHTYQSIEMEGNHYIALSKKTNLGIGYLIGYKLQNEIAFRSKIGSIDNASQYSPAQGIGSKAYMNLLLSIMYKL